MIYDSILKDVGCIEISVEDPSPEFQSMRDLLDVKFILKRGFMKWALQFKKKHPNLHDFKSIELKKSDIEEITKTLKITKNQVKRVFEILLLANVNTTNPEYFKHFKEIIKRRLYQANRTEFFPFLKKKYPLIYIDGINLFLLMISSR